MRSDRRPRSRAGGADDVRSLLAQLSPTARPVVESLRRLVRAAAPDAIETVVWGSLSYHRPPVGGRVKGSVCLITAKRGEVRLEFVHGVRLPDPGRLLRGGGVSKRHVPFDPEAPPPRRALVELVREAARIEWPAAGC